MTIRQPTIHIELTTGGVSLFVAIESQTLVERGDLELLLRIHQALLGYFAAIAVEGLPVIA